MPGCHHPLVVAVHDVLGVDALSYLGHSSSLAVVERLWQLLFVALCRHTLLVFLVGVGWSRLRDEGSNGGLSDHLSVVEMVCRLL